MQGRWIQIDPEELGLPQPETIRGVQVTVLFSPYDVPESVRGQYDQSLDRFLIEFSYLGGAETPRFSTFSQHVELGIGVRTGRLHQIRLNVKAMKVMGVCLDVRKAKAEVNAAISELERHPTIPRPPLGNYEAVAKVVSQQGDELFADLVMAS
jgi:hypothetical protein